ncbi:MAG: DEAD/DEAH box helicase, partial [Desulfomonilaceae bacterium]
MEPTESFMVDVCFPLPVDGPYTYEVPIQLRNQVGFGRRVLAPFGKKIRAGFIVGLNPEVHHDGVIKEILEIPREQPCFDQPWWDFIKWVSNYYMSSTGLVLKTAIPVGFERRSEPWIKFTPEGKAWLENISLHEGGSVQLKLSKHYSISRRQLISVIGKKQLDAAMSLGFVTTEEHLAHIRPEKIDNSRVFQDINPKIDHGGSSGLKLTPDQDRACAIIRESILNGGFAPYLLFGVTGSGKTEVYLKNIRETLRLGKRALMLVPEIALTPQSAKRIVSKFGHNMSIFHSGITNAQKIAEWRKIMRGDTKIVVATRSGIFTPIPNLG